MYRLKFLNHFVTHKSNLQVCCFCDEPLHHLIKTKEGKVWKCVCGASFIYPNREKEARFKEISK
jgi:hypothetical protein